MNLSFQFLAQASALKVFQDMLGEVDRVDISSDKVARMIICATHGRLREIRKLLVRWVEIGFQKKIPSLTLDDLAKSFEEVIFPEVPKKLTME